MSPKTGIVAFTFATPYTTLPNPQVAQLALSCDPSIPIFTQADFGPVPEGRDVTVLPERPNEPPPTYRIARGAMAWAKERGIERVEVICVPPHTYRALRDLERAALEIKGARPYIVRFRNLGWARFQCFSPESGVWWSRSPLLWWFRESIIRLLPFWLYRRIAS